MGKKHKKHKSDRHFYEEYVEKPLKLVLKVGGSEVTELSTGSSGHDSSLFEDRSDHDKHKDRKRKKRKKGEKQAPGEEKGRKRRRVKEDKKKRDRDRVENEAEKDFQCHAPVRLDLPPEKPLTSSLARQEEVEQTPLQEALNQLMRQLQRKDPSAFFSFPVTDFIAPGYSMIIKHPMDFSTMKEKIKNNDYQSIEELKERIQSLKQSIDFMADLQKTRKQKDRTDASQSGEDSGCWQREREDSGDAETQAFRSPTKDNKKKDKDVLDDKWRSGNSEREHEQIERVVQESGGKLTRRPANSQCEFERRKPDGTTTLGLLHPVEPIVGVLYLNYGPYSSYAPHYDSTFANISKDDSDLIYSTYGEDSDLPNNFSISEFLATCQDYPYVMADSLLDVLTKGGHSRSLQDLDVQIAQVEPTGRLESSSQDRLTALQAVTNFGAPAEVFDSEAEQVTNNLKELTQQVTPGDVVSIHGVRKAMGISVPSPIMGNSFVDLTEECEEPKEACAVECGPDRS
ncbi:bromodomain-containing protein 7 [Cricetulus griseus]|nr:bromodomain-containing protein 7 [Cricetulus griseus]